MFPSWNRCARKKTLLKVDVFFVSQRLQLHRLVLKRRTGATRQRMAARVSRRSRSKLKWRWLRRTQLSIYTSSRTARDCGFSVKHPYRSSSSVVEGSSHYWGIIPTTEFCASFCAKFLRLLIVLSSKVRSNFTMISQVSDCCISLQSHENRVVQVQLPPCFTKINKSKSGATFWRK